MTPIRPSRLFAPPVAFAMQGLALAIPLPLLVDRSAESTVALAQACHTAICLVASLV